MIQNISRKYQFWNVSLSFIRVSNYVYFMLCVEWKLEIVRPSINITDKIIFVNEITIVVCIVLFLNFEGDASIKH